MLKTPRNSPNNSPADTELAKELKADELKPPVTLTHKPLFLRNDLKITVEKKNKTKTNEIVLVVEEEDEELQFKLDM